MVQYHWKSIYAQINMNFKQKSYYHQKGGIHKLSLGGFGHCLIPCYIFCIHTIIIIFYMSLFPYLLPTFGN